MQNSGESHNFLKICFVFIFIIFSGLIFFPENDVSPMVMAQTTPNYDGPENCEGCHSKQYDEWSTTNHSRAYENPVFQEQWDDEGQPGECLECHTTGYDVESESFQFEGVTCELCHGPKHTSEIDTSTELCQQCHTGEYAQPIEKGTHGIAGATCVDCHQYKESHTPEPSIEACVECHTKDAIHTTSLIPDLRSEVSGLQRIVSPLEANLTILVTQLEEHQAVVDQVESTYTDLLYGGVVATISVIGWIGVFILRPKS